MRTLLIFFVFGFITNLSAQETQLWLTDMDLAKKEAVSSKKNILVSFSGSDWCGNCMRLDKEFFQTEDFKKYASEHLVLLKLDFPAKKANKLSASQTEHNDKWADVYNKTGVFPLTILINAQGKLLGQMKYPSSSTEAYLNSISSMNK